MATWADVERIALSLSETQEGTTFRNRAWKVAGKTFAWERPLDGYAAVLVLIANITASKLRPVIEDAWLSQAPEELAGAFLARRKHS